MVDDDGASLNELNSDFDHASLWPQLNYPRVVWGLPGGFLMPNNHHLADRYKALKRVRFGRVGTPELSLGLLAVTVTADGFNIMHASIANSWFFSEFAPILIIPDRACAATRHHTCYAVVDALQPDFVIVFTEQANVFLIRYAFGHVIAHPDGAESVDPVPNFAPAMDPPSKNGKHGQLFPDARTKML